MSGSFDHNIHLVVVENAFKLVSVISILGICHLLPFVGCEAQPYQFIPIINSFPPHPAFYYLYGIQNPTNLQRGVEQYPQHVPQIIHLTPQLIYHPTSFVNVPLIANPPLINTLKRDATIGSPPVATDATQGVPPVVRKTFTCGVKGTPRHSKHIKLGAVDEGFETAEKTLDSVNWPLLESYEFDGPDLTNTSFHRHLESLRIVATKITYGEVAEINEAPWQVAIFVGGRFHCGASLVGPDYILTAAHCVTSYKNRPNALKIIIGDWDLDTVSDGKHIEAKVKRVVAHTDFNFFTLQNDIALLELEEKIVFNERIQPICMPLRDLSIKGELVTVTGWGRNERNLLQTKLQKLTAAVIENELCADRWSRSGAPRSLIGSGTLCMDTQYGDSCKGDSGGPSIMEYPEGSGTFVQVGIVSFGSGSCTDPALPGVYTRVASFRDWIDNNIK